MLAPHALDCVVAGETSGAPAGTAGRWPTLRSQSLSSSGVFPLPSPSFHVHDFLRTLPVAAGRDHVVAPENCTGGVLPPLLSLGAGTCEWQLAEVILSKPAGATAFVRMTEVQVVGQWLMKRKISFDAPLANDKVGRGRPKANNDRPQLASQHFVMISEQWTPMQNSLASPPLQHATSGGHLHVFSSGTGHFKQHAVVFGQLVGPQVWFGQVCTQGIVPGVATYMGQG